MSLFLASAIHLLLLPFILLSSLPFLHKKNADKEFNDTAQFQCRPEGDNIQFNSTVAISSMCMKQQSLYRLAAGWTVRESNPGGREFSCYRLN